MARILKEARGRESYESAEESRIQEAYYDPLRSIHSPTDADNMVKIGSRPLSLQEGSDGSDSSEIDSDIECAQQYAVKRLPRAKAKKARKIETTKKHSKGPTKPMREIQKTMDQILWDARFDETEWRVGYEDRHSARMLEKELIDWKPKGGKLKDVMEEEFIPLSRIQYLRRENSDERLWDRASRTDRVEGWARETQLEADDGEKIEALEIP